jgi:heme/copper-type cytochrome/quinol oxidase subunit 2
MTLNTHRRARAGAAPTARTAIAVKANTAKSRSRRTVEQLACTVALVALVIWVSASVVLIGFVARARRRRAR